MAFFGRESDADRDRAERIRHWAQSRSPYALASILFGIIAVLDAFTLVIGVAAGIMAVVLAGLGVADLNKQPHLIGRSLCKAGIVLGTIGILTSFGLWWFVYR